MTRQTVNLLGGLVVLVILLAGLFLGVLPRLDQASQSRQDRDRVAAQNRTEESLLTAYGQQRSQLPTLQAQVAALKQQIPDGPHLEQLIGMASGLPGGAVLRSITPSDAAPAVAPATPTTPAAPGTTSASQPAASAGFTAVPVTVTISIPAPADAEAVLDKLRSGPRLFAIDHVTLSAASGSGKAASSTLTVAGRVFTATVTP